MALPLPEVSLEGLALLAQASIHLPDEEEEGGEGASGGDIGVGGGSCISLPFPADPSSHSTSTLRVSLSATTTFDSPDPHTFEIPTSLASHTSVAAVHRTPYHLPPHAPHMDDDEAAVSASQPSPPAPFSPRAAPAHNAASVEGADGQGPCSGTTIKSSDYADEQVPCSGTINEVII